MKKNWTRRKFLRTGLGSSIAVGATLGGPTVNPTRGSHSKDSHDLSAAERKALRAVMDEIIPAVDDMPAASEVGGVDYLARLASADTATHRAVNAGLAGLDAIAMKDHQKQFASLAGGKRVETLQAYESKSPEEFEALRDLVYEAYYTQPRVWKLIGYEFDPTNEEGPHMKPFDETLLAQVKKMPKRYREVT